MQSVGGIFTSCRDGERAAERLHARGFSADHGTILAPGSQPDVSAIATDEGERSGVGAALGGVVGGAAGAAGGKQAAAAMAAGFIPGIGPVIAAGLLGAALVGATGAVVGTAMEHAMANGLPKDEWLVYEDAMRRGKTVLIALPNDESQAVAAREVLGDSVAAPTLVIPDPVLPV
jgi:hypothetical protein